MRNFISKLAWSYTQWKLYWPESTFMPRNCITDWYLFGILAGSVSLLAIENDIHHTDNILQQIISFVCFSEGRIDFSEKINGLLPRNWESLRIKLIVNLRTIILILWFFKMISEKSVSYHVNDLFNFEAIDRLFSQKSNFFLQKQTKDVICLWILSNLLQQMFNFDQQTRKRTCQHVRHVLVSNTILRHKGPFWSVMFPLSINSSKLLTEVLHTKFDLQYFFVKEMLNWKEIWQARSAIHVQ